MRHYGADREVEREEVTLDATGLREICGPVEIDEAGEALSRVAAKLGVTVECLRYARKGNMFRQRGAPRFRGVTPILHRDGLMDPSAPLGRTSDRLWGWAWRSAARRLADDFAQVVERRPEYRMLRGRRVARGWRWICPGCGRRARVIFLPVRPINLAEYFGVRPERDEVDAVSELPRTFACTRRHRVRYFSRVDRGAWNALIAHASGGLMYGREVRRPDYWEETRKREYRRSARRTPSRRRAEVRERVVAGMKVRAIARELGIGVNTVTGHMKVIYKAEGVHSRRELQEKAEGLADGAAAAVGESRPRDSDKFLLTNDNRLG